jgi:hypothetical protein
MKKALPMLALALVLLTAIHASLAQTVGPLVIIQGTPDTTTAPPEVRTYVSVVDWNKAETIEGLTASNFSVKEAEADVGTPGVSYEPVGLAVVIVVDRGGISAPGDPRIKEATDLARGLIDRLSVTGAPDDDMVAVVAVGEEGALEPEAGFSYNPVDTNLARNALVQMEGEAVQGGTPLYEGLDEALRLLTANPNATIRDVLSHRRKVVVVFSDGIDPNFSDEVREQDIIRKANAADISLYTIGMARRNGQLSAEGNLKRLAHETYGLYQLHNSDESHAQVLTLFDRVVTQRDQYVVSYETRRPSGTYALNIRVDTSIGSADDSVDFSSTLELPRLSLTTPTDGERITVPISYTQASCLLLSTQRKGFRYLATPIVLSTQVVAVDEASRDPADVSYFANGVLVGTGTTPPAFDFAWDVSTVVTPTDKTQSQEFTLAATADDAYLGKAMVAQPVTIQVTWEPIEQTGCGLVATWLSAHWWLLLVLVALVLGLLVLLILLIRTRGEVARKIVTRTTGVLKGVTKRLSAPTQRAPGKLVILHGANMGREFRLSTQVVKVGRDPQFCDFALYDDYVSNPHFSVQLEQTQFFITDEGSTNGTRVNGAPIPPHQRTLLQPDAIIEVGGTRLQFKRLGGTTRQLGQAGSPGGGYPPPQGPPPQQQPPGGAPWSPTQQPPPGAPPWPPTQQPPQQSGFGGGGTTQQKP